MAEREERVQQGLRERKKRATRDAIATAARDLFAERGFDNVTVSEVAFAADVSEKTVYNHFATKEDLALDGGEAKLDQLLDAIRGRPAGTSVLDVFRGITEGMIDHLETAPLDDAFFVVPRIARGSRVLRQRLATGWEHEATAMTAAIAESTDGDDEVLPAVAAHTLSWAHRTIFGIAYNGLLAGEDRTELAARLRVACTRAYDQIAAGLGEYGA